jgi:phage shock protein A
MSIFHRMNLVFQEKANAALDKAEDPGQALDLSYEKMLEQLQKVRRSIADVLTGEKRLELQRDSLQAQMDKLQQQARAALQANQEDTARTALSRAQIIKTQIEGMGPQIAQLKQQEQQLEVTGEKLRARIEAFRAQKETLKAQAGAAKASSQAMEGVTGLSEQMADVTLLMDRAQDKVARLQARAAAVGELADTGALDALSITAGDDIDARLGAAALDSGVDAQLAAMKQEMGLPGGAPAPALGAGGGGDATFVVRIAGEDQYRLPASSRSALDDLDADLLRAVDGNDADAFTRDTKRLVDLVHALGTKLPHEDLSKSDVIVPGTDMTLEDAKKIVDAVAGAAPTAG